MKYELKRLVCTEDERHIVLPAGKDIKTDIAPQTYIYFKVNVANKFAPARVLV